MKLEIPNYDAQEEKLLETKEMENPDNIDFFEWLGIASIEDFKLPENPEGVEFQLIIEDFLKFCKCKLETKKMEIHEDSVLVERLKGKIGSLKDFGFPENLEK